MRFYLREFLLSQFRSTHPLLFALSQLLYEWAHKRERSKRTLTRFCRGEFLLSHFCNARALSFHSLSKLLCEGAHKGERAKRTKKRFFRREFENFACSTQAKIVEFLNAINQFNSSIKIGPRSHLDRISHVYLPLFCFLLDPTNLERL